jgi:hypothetical protein
MAGTEVSETILTGGQNEGIERTILPLPQLSYVQNARQRKTGRWGKRFGTATLPSTNATSIALGSGAGDVRSVGQGFCIVDDQCAVYDQNAAVWIDPATICTQNTGGLVANAHIPGAISGWLPDISYYPVPPASQQNQQLTPCAQCYGLGYLWSAISFLDQNNAGDAMIRVVATNPTDNSLVFLQDIVAGVAAQGGLVYPRLLLSGTTIVLTYVSRPNNAARFVGGRILTTLSGKFGAEVSITTFISAAAIYDTCVFVGSGIKFLLVSTDGTNTAHVCQVSNSTLGIAFTRNYVDAAALTWTSLACAAANVYLTSISTTPALRVTVYDISLTAVGTANVDLTAAITAGAGGSIAYSSTLSGGGVRCAYTSGVSPVRIMTADVTTAATIISSKRGTQWRMTPCSRPFSIGTQVYIWGFDYTGFSQQIAGASVGFGYPTLIRLPSISEYVGAGFSATYPEITSPIEMSPQDFFVGTRASGSIGVLDLQGLPNPTQLGSSADYSFMVPTVMNIADVLATTYACEFRVIQAKHFSDAPARRSVLPIYADLSTFVPGGVLSRIDARGSVEEGFVSVPSIFTATPGAGGSLTVGSTYQYVTLYRSQGTNGRFEISGPCPVATAVLGGAQNQVTLSIYALDLGARQNVQTQIYRTLANGTIFHLVATVDGGPDPNSTGFRGFIDKLSDADAATRPVLPTQVGNALANGFPPPSRFGTVGGQRLWLGGLLRNDVIQCSKLIFGDQSPSFTASADQFSIVIPAACTGLAWMDNLVAFTNEGIYIISGDGPDDSGNGSFSPPIRLPFALGCIEPRSVITVDEGTFFQSARGLYLLPRGFGAPQPAGDVVMDTLTTFPIITGSVVSTKSTEQLVYWSCVNSPIPSNGVQIVYDLVHKSWSVDTLTDSFIPASPPASHTCIGTWFGGECIMGEAQIGSSLIPLKASVASFADSANSITMIMRTGDLRPFGSMSEGVISKLTTLAELRSACTLDITKTTEWGVSPIGQRVFSGAGPDYTVGQLTYTETELGAAELRNAISLRLQWDETSTQEGLAFIALGIEHEQGEGLKRPTSLSRTT